MSPPREPSNEPAPPGAGPALAALGKDGLRVQMRRLRQAVPAAERTRRGALVVSSLLSLSEIQNAEAIVAFSSFGSEVPTGGLLSSLERAGATIYLPFLESGEMSVAEHRADEPLVETAYGPYEPLLRRPADLSRIGAVITPGLAFDRAGGRLGYGGGYYDRFLRRLAAGVAVLGIAFAEQVVEAVPVDRDDVLVDVVVTDREVIYCSRAGGTTPG